ncbi:unnamed protein product [Polarella glacialis]|uniref:Protein NLRC3 n=1 Tax=Polarella glacialis TaxID=89957 RepID=A0A813G155_POLGL|nr:unnamed protein product [Polarella glacialis]
MARPAHMASGDEVTALMKARQWEKPEQWTMTVQHWVDIVGACTETPQYKSVMEQKKTVNMHDVCRLFVKPWSEGTGCSLAVLMSREVVCNAQLMVSHCWGEDVSETKESLLQHAVRHELPMTVPIWFCVFSNYQPEDGVGPKLEHQLALEPFASVIRNPSLKAANGGHGMVALHTTTDDLYSRLWCVHEVERAIVEEDVEIIASMSQKYIDLMVGRVEQFLGLGATLNDCFRAAGVQVQTAKARCSSKDDEEKLVKLILQQGNGFDGLDKVVEDFRREQLPDIIFEKLIRKGLTRLDGASTSARANAAVVFAACQAHGAGQLQHATTNPEVSERIRLAGLLGNDELRWQDIEVLDLEDLQMTLIRKGLLALDGASTSARADAAIVFAACQMHGGGQLEHATNPEVRERIRLALRGGNRFDEKLRWQDLEVIDLEDLKLGQIFRLGVRTLAEDITQLRQSAKLSLALAGEGLGAKGCKTLFEAIAKQKQITDLSLDLGRNGLGFEGSKAVSEGIAQLKQITDLSLDLTNNNLGDEGSKAVAEAIAQLKQITDLSLDLSLNSLGDESGQAVFEAIAQLKQITDLSLDLRFNYLGDKGRKAVSEGIAQLKHITNLHLSPTVPRFWRYCPEPWEEQLLRAGPLTSQQLSLFLDKCGISKDVEQTFCKELRFAPEEIIRCLSSISGLSGSPVRAARAARDARSRRGEELRQMKGHLKRSWAKTIQELAEIEGVSQQEGIETPEIPVQESPVRDPSQSGQQQVRAGADLEDHSMARPKHMASGDEVTALMKARQWEKPEQWTMTVQHWVDIVGACTETPQYKSVMEQKKTVNMHDVCRLFVKPWSEGTGCSLAVLMSREVVCNAQLMVSHCWGEDVSETKESLLQHAVRHELPMTVPIWFCVFSNYQPEDGVGPKLEHQLALEPFASVIRNPSLKAANGGHGMVALHTTTDDLYSRLWCVHEVERAIVEEDVEIKASMSQKYIDLMVGRVEQFLGLGATLNDCFRAAGVQVQTAKARCSSKDDEEKLVKLILQQANGFDGLDKVVEDFRREQLPDIIFETLGCVLCLLFVSFVTFIIALK